MVHLLSLLLLLLLLLLQTESLQFPNTNRRNVLKAAATSATAVILGGVKNANAAIDVSGLPVEQQPSLTANNSSSNNNARGVNPSQLKSGPFANTKLGFQVGGGPRSEEVVRAIDQPRYDAVRKAQGLGPAFLDGVPREGENKMSR